MLRTYLKRDEGSAAIEAAFIIPILFLLGFGAADASLMLRQTHAMEQGLVAGGTYLARATDPQSTLTSTKAKNIAVTGAPAGTGTARVSGWKTTDVAINYQSIANTGDYRGGSTVLVAQLSSTRDYQGLGVIRTVSGGTAKITVLHEERLVRAE